VGEEGEGEGREEGDEDKGEGLAAAVKLATGVEKDLASMAYQLVLYFVCWP